jgi:xanthine dehydrogenase YagS FAD-binding subunit
VRPFGYQRPGDVAEAVAMLAAARPLAGNAFKVPLARNVIASTLLELVEEAR